MTKYLALLRGINVGGQKLIKMKELQKMLSSIKEISNVKTYLQTGNILLDTSTLDGENLEKELELFIQQKLGYKVNVIVRRLSSIMKMYNDDPFKDLISNRNEKYYVCFLQSAPLKQPILPLINAKDRLEVFKLDNKDAYIISRRKSNGWYGFPNNFIEKELSLISTARNWTTIYKIVRYSLKQ
jgi:uncharacterized protein (DUF1697 family)